MDELSGLARAAARRNANAIAASEGASQNDELSDVIRAWSIGFYRAQDDVSPAGVAVFAADMLAMLHAPGDVLARAQAAARARRARYVVADPSPAQDSLREAIIAEYRRSGPTHDQIEAEAAAFADTVIPLFGDAAIENALDHAHRRGVASARLAETESRWWGKARSARSERPAPRRRLYDC
jgi:hypothetical protein